MPELLLSAVNMAIGLPEALVADLTQQGSLYEVGGTVRDALLTGQPPSKDFDYLVTGIPYEQLCRLLKQHGRVDVVGKSFGVIKFLPHDSPPHSSAPFDFALPRREYSTGVGHRDFTVEFDHALPVEADLVRRDFTINAIAREVTTGKFVDPLDGRSDLQRKLIRHTSPESFKEDPLRMLRAVQFAARFEFAIEPETFQSMCDHAHLITTITPERIAEELNKLLLKARKPSIGFLLMQKSGLLNLILPELEAAVGVTQPGPYHKWPVFEHTLAVVDAAPLDLQLRMAALLHDLGKPATKRLTDAGSSFYGHDALGTRLAHSILERLRYSNDFTDSVCRLVERHMFTTDVTDKGLRRLIRKAGLDLIFPLLELRRADTIGQGMGQTNDDVDELERRIRAELDKKPPFGLADLALDGNDIMREFNLQPGPAVGKILNHLLEYVLDYPEHNDYQTLLIEAKRYYASQSDNG